MEFTYTIDMLLELSDRRICDTSKTIPLEEEGMNRRTPANRAGRMVGSFDTMQPLDGLCDELAIAMLAVRQIDILHDNETDVERGSVGNPGIEDARDVYEGARWIGSELPSQGSSIYQPKRRTTPIQPRLLCRYKFRLFTRHLDFE
jgi:hypothetical protein